MRDGRSIWRKNRGQRDDEGVLLFLPIGSETCRDEESSAHPLDAEIREPHE